MIWQYEMQITSPAATSIFYPIFGESKRQKERTGANYKKIETPKTSIVVEVMNAYNELHDDVNQPP